MPKCQKCGQVLPERQLRKFTTFFFRIPIELKWCERCVAKEENKFNNQIKVVTAFFLVCKILILFLVAVSALYGIYSYIIKR